jgi:hypothetical protein
VVVGDLIYFWDKPVDRNADKVKLSTAWSGYLKLFMKLRQQKTAATHTLGNTTSPCHSLKKIVCPQKAELLTTMPI